MVLRACHRHRALVLFASCSIAIAPFGCGTDEGGNQPQSLATNDAGSPRGGSAGQGGGSAGEGGSSGTAATTPAAAATLPAAAAQRLTPDAAEEPTEPCGKEFQPCCGLHQSACGKSATLTCNDGACVTCAGVPAPSPVCKNFAIWGTATANLTRPPDEAAPSYAPELAIDDDVCNVWASGDYAVNPETRVTETWWQLDLGGLHKLSVLTLWLAMTPPGMVTLHVEYGFDGKTWKPAWGGTRAMSGHAPWTEGFAPPIEARFVRIKFVDSPSWISIREFAAFECPGA